MTVDGEVGVAQFQGSDGMWQGSGQGIQTLAEIWGGTCDPTCLLPHMLPLSLKVSLCSGEAQKWSSRVGGWVCKSVMGFPV